MKTLQPTEYTYASARIRSLENRLVGRERAEILIESRTPDEVMDRLAEYGYPLPEGADGTVPVGEAISAAREAMLLAVLRELMQLRRTLEQERQAEEPADEEGDQDILERIRRERIDE